MSLHRHKHIIDQRHTNGRDQLSMSLTDKSTYQSIPNQWKQSAINVLHGHKHIIAHRQTNGHDQLSMSGHKNLINQCQINGHDQLSTASTDTSMQLSMPNWHNLQLIHLEQGQDYSLAVISM